MTDSVVRSIIAESEDEFGYQFGHSGSLYDIFVKPVVDASKVAGAEVKKTVARGRHLARTAVESLIATLIPVLDADYDKIDADLDKRLSRAHAEAGDAYDEIRKVMKGSDAVMFSLLYSPSTTITSAIGEKLAHKLRRAFGIDEGVRSGDARLRRASELVRDAVHDKLRHVTDQATHIAAAKSAKDLNKILPTKIAVKDVSDVRQFKQRACLHLANLLFKDAKELVSNGVSPDSKLIKDHGDAIRFIRSKAKEIK